MPRISPIIRISIGLILLTVSLLLIGDLLGLAPDQSKAELKARKAIAEALAVQVSTDISQNRIEAVANTINALQSRNDDVLSIGLRRSDGRLLASSGNHVEHWDPNLGERSTSSHLQVPIHGEQGLWGVVEVSFLSLGSLWSRLFRGGSIATVILFVAFSGFAAYWLFLKRALKELDPSAVIPDRVRAALDVLSEGLVILDRSGRIVLVNSSFENKLGKPRDALVGSSLSTFDWASVTDESQDSISIYPWQQLLDSGEVQPAVQIGLLTPSKERLAFAVNCSPVKSPEGAVRGVVVTFDDLTRLEKKNQDLERALQRLEQSQREITRQNHELQVLATRDPLTGVLNRRSLFEGMKTLMDEAKASAEPLSCIMVDIDHFKSINDRFGHATGDKVIKMLSAILTDTARAEDLVGRYGGEEFCVVLPSSEEAVAAEVAERMRLTINDGKSARFTSALRISASFGVSTFSGQDINPNGLVDLADRALYVAKESGRNKVIRWSRLAESDDVKGASTEDESSPSDISQVASQPPAADPDHALLKDNEGLRTRIAELETVLGEHLGKENRGYDDRTGLPSRIVLLDRIGQAIERSRRAGCQMVLMSLAVDAVEVVRNARGVGTADKLMRIIGARLRKAVRSADTVAVPESDDIEISVSMLGSGEFAVLLSDMHNAESTTWVVQRIYSTLGETIEVDGGEVMIDARTGISIFPGDADDSDDLLANAAVALREARATQDRNTCLYYNKAMNLRSKEQLAMQAQLLRAIERGELFLEYQPAIDLREGRIVGFEALLRWKHPEFGLVRPDRFIPIAENAGLIDKLGDWVVSAAARQLKSWQDMGCEKLTMAVNFSALQFRREDLVERVVSVVEGAGIDPATLVIEITESTLIQNLETAVSAVERLSKAGLCVALDDFGTGYSSLSYLKRFPIDVLKIDRSFLRDFPAEAHDTEIVSAIIGIAHNLGLRVVAEGVETERQLQVLQNLQCDEIQGYLFSEPISRERAAALLINPSKIRRIVRNSEFEAGLNIDSRHPAVAGVINAMPHRSAAG